MFFIGEFMTRKQEKHYTIDENQIIDAIDDKLANIDLNTLYKIKENLESTNDDTELIDKAIAKKKKEQKHLTFSEVLAGIFLSSSKKTKKDKKIDYLMPSEQNEVKKGNHDSWNFEEEELEDDDYYNV